MNLFLIKFVFSGEKRRFVALVAAEDEDTAAQNLRLITDDPIEILNVKDTTSDKLLQGAIVVMP